MKKNHIVIKSVLKRAEKPLDAQGIMIRWFDDHRPINLNRDLEDMVQLGILSKSDKGYYSLVPTVPTNPQHPTNP